MPDKIFVYSFFTYFFFLNCFIEINRGYVHMYTTTTKKIDDDFSNGDGTE